MTGGALGSIAAQIFHMTASERKTLLVAGAAGGMSATFGTPIAAVLLAVELLLFEWKPRSFIPVAIASAVAAAVRGFLGLDVAPLFEVPLHLSDPSSITLLSSIVVGLLAGVLSLLLTASVYASEDAFEHIPIHWMWWPAIGGLVVGIGGYFEPRALGVGYDIIADLLNGHIVATALIGLFAVKLIIWIFALASGTSGGVLAPLLIFGCSIGTLVSGLSTGGQSAGVWALIGMGAIMGGMMRSPLTAIIFCFELTNDSQIFLPLLIAATA